MQPETAEQAQATEEVTRRPFHETIVDAIKGTLNTGEMECLGRLINMTKIPKNHEMISDAWEQQRKAFCWPANSFEVLPGLLKQQREAEKQP